MMSAFTSLFADDPFFSPDRMLWPLRGGALSSLHGGALSSLQQDFFNRRSKLADSLLTELHEEHPLLRLRPLPLLSSTLTGLTDGKELQREAPSTELTPRHAHPIAQSNGDLLVTLDARGYAPSDITVKLEGRSLAVVAMKQAAAEESETCSSSSSSAAFCSSAASQTGFVQKIDLPPHLDLSGLSCSLMDDGQLRIHAPVAKPPGSEEQEEHRQQKQEKQPQEEEEQPVRFRTSLEFPIKKDKEEHTN